MTQPTQELPQPPRDDRAAGKRRLRIGVLVAGLAVAGALGGGVIAAAATSGSGASPAASTPQPKKEHKNQRGDRPLKLKDGQKLLVGAVASVQDGKLVVNRDGGGQVTASTDDKTKIAGAGRKALTDLRPGDRVTVKVDKDGHALGVLAAQSNVVGTVTSLQGSRGTVEQRDGMVTTVDFAGVSGMPKVGDLVAVHGSAQDNGATLKADKIRQLPHAG